MNTKFYEIGGYKFNIEHIGVTTVQLMVKDTRINASYKFYFADESKAMAEILSYAEIEKEDFE